jgi:hypothetical protein
MTERRTRRAQRWLPLVTAGTVVLLAAGLTLGLSTTHRGRPPAAAPSPDATPAGPVGELVRDGTRVVVSGQVRAGPGRPVRMCAPLPVPVTDVAYPPGREPAPGYCLGVTLVGADLAALTDRQVLKGVVLGQARVEGRYAAGVVTVDRQGPPEPSRDRATLPQRPGCPTPAGGWRPGRVETRRLQEYVAARGDRYAGLWLTYPDGVGGPHVPVVGTVLDPAAAERALRTVYAGNLCVVHSPRSAATLARISARLAAGMTDHHAYEVGPNPVAGSVDVRLLIVDPAARRWLDQADDRTGAVTPHPFVRPLG